MKLGIVGLPNAGKTTVFNALTHAGALATAYAFSAAEANHGVVPVPDERLDRLHAALQTPKCVHATIDVIDIPGLASGAGHGEGLGARFLAEIRGVDALAHVVRAFDNPEVAFVRDHIDPLADVRDVETELILSDIELIERRKDKTAKAARSGDKAAQKEMVVLDRVVATLGDGAFARTVERGKEEESIFRDLALLTERPVLFVLDTDEDHLEGEGDDLIELAKARGDEVVALPAKLEVELAELTAAEAAEFRGELGIPAGGVDELIAACYRVLGYITFFTGDHKSSETRAWQLPQGQTAWQAAGRIHGDIQKGFVRAEVVPLEDTVACRSFAHAREKGVLRVEGKDYVVRDGDVIHFRHTA